jgi:hypothetical protein
VDLLDPDTYTDLVSDAIDDIGEAGDLIGGILKSVSPLLAMVPGIGTAFSVAVYAAGAIAAKDSITDALIGTASAAMPPGVPRIAFDGGISITRDVAEGRPVIDSAIAACRNAARAAGGAPAAEAFDAGIAVLKGGPVDQRIIDQGRAFARETGGVAAAASFDAGVAVAQGKSVDHVVIEVARGYVNEMGGPVALAAFDTAVALGYAKTLQEAGYAGLHTFAKGNTAIEKILNFIEKVGRARTLRQGVQDVLESDLGQDFLHGLQQYIPNPSASAIEDSLQPYVDTFRDHLELLDQASGDLAKYWEVDEAIVRAAQALTRSRDGNVDQALLASLKSVKLASDSGGDAAGTKARNDALARSGEAMAKGDAVLTAHRSNSRVYPPALWARGFDVGTAVSYRQSAFGPGQAVIRDSLRGPSQLAGYNVGRDLQYQRTLAIQRALEGLAKDVLSVRDKALAAYGAGLGAATTTTVREARAALTIPLAPKSPAAGSTDRRPDPGRARYAGT